MAHLKIEELDHVRDGLQAMQDQMDVEPEYVYGMIDMLAWILHGPGEPFTNRTLHEVATTVEEWLKE